MRVLVACPHCLRRYETSERKIGAKFRCHCGAVLKVRKPQGHEAAVVRCSSCGGARQGSDRNCGFCGADFTLHERDLNTVCPNCLARVSDKARYCSQCGERLAAEAIAGKDSNAVCPACPDTEHLASRELGHEKLNVLECQACTGLWLSVETFRELRDRTARGAAHLDEAVFAQARPRQRADQKGPLYRPCVQCGKLMSRRQYAHRQRRDHRPLQRARAVVRCGRASSGAPLDRRRRPVRRSHRSLREKPPQAPNTLPSPAGLSQSPR